ncbi:MAG: PQQ-dependent sugar dehydrogenase [Bdellovibrionales bacterium]
MKLFAMGLLLFSVSAVSKVEMAFESDLDVIWAFEFMENDQFLLTTRDGKLMLADRKTNSTKPINGLPKIHVSGQGGLLDVIKDRDFKNNKFIYLTYSKKTKSGSTTALFRAKLVGQSLIEGKDIFVAKTNSSTSRHYGSRVRQDKNGNLFMSIGDRGKRHDSQKLSNHQGTIVRIDREGKALPDNPFVKDSSALPEIYSYGHRNPQGMDYSESEDQIYVNEHGPRGGDEINKIMAGKNYGWPVITYGKEYWGPSIGEGKKKSGMEQPLFYFVPSIAPSGLVYYQSDLHPEWRKSFFSGALVLEHLNRVYFDGKSKSYKEDRSKEIANMELRVRSVKVNRKGELYFSSDEGDIYRYQP